MVYGVGINDLINKNTDNKFSTDFIYKAWSGMLQRCYSEKWILKRPQHINCIVVDEWLVYSNFKKWAVTQNYKNNVLDKDLIKPGNKIYSPATCAFISKQLNAILTDSIQRRGNLPPGVLLRVTDYKISKPYRARCSAYGDRISLGDYETISEAYNAYKKYKSNHLRIEANKQKDIRIRKGLIKHAKIIEEKVHGYRNNK